MNRIDKEYKKRFNEQSYPESLKQKGWTDMKEMLDNEMPVGGGFSWGKMGAAFIAVAVVCASLWYFLKDDQIPDSDNNISNIEAIKHKESQEKTIATDKKSDITETARDTENQEQESNEQGSPELKGNVSPLSTKTNNSIAPVEDKQERPANVAVTNPVNDLPMAIPSKTENSDNTVVKDNLIADADKSVKTGDSPDFSKVKDDEGFSKSQAGEDKDVPPGIDVTPDQELEIKTPGISSENTGSTPSSDVENKLIDDNRSDSPVVPVGDTDSDERAPAEESSDEAITTRYQHLAFSGFEGEDNLWKENTQLTLFSREHFSINAFVGYDYVGKILQSDNAVYLAKRRDEERPVWAYSGGVTIDYYLDRDWVLSIGIGLSDYGEEVAYTPTETSEIAYLDGRYNSPAEFPTRTDVDSVRIIDSINVGHWNYTVTYTKRNDSVTAANGRTSWKYIEFPAITMKRRFGKGKVRPWLGGGLSLGLLQQTQFRYIDNQATLLLEEGQIGVNAARWQLNALFKVGVDIYLTRNFSLKLNGSGSTQLNTSLKQEGVRQRYYRLGGAIGIGYNF